MPKPSHVTGQAAQPVFGIHRVANPRHPQTQFGYWSGEQSLCYAPLPGSAPDVHTFSQGVALAQVRASAARPQTLYCACGAVREAEGRGL